MAHKVYKVNLQSGPSNSTISEIQAVLDKVDADLGTVVAEIAIGGVLFITAKLP